MKTLNKILLIVLIIITWGCADKFLDETPFSELSPANFYQNDADANAAAIGIYNTLTSDGYYGLAYYVAETMTDIIRPRLETSATTGQSLGNYFHDASHGYVANAWRDSYELIKRANTTIENVEGNSNISESTQQRVVAEAKFLRGMTYYHMVQFFGDVPLVTESYQNLSNLEIPRTPADEVWQQVIQDLSDAIAGLPLKSDIPESELGRATKGAARHLLAKSYMALGQIQPALSLINDIIDSDEYALYDDITDNWNVSKENGDESIFEIQFYDLLSGPTIGSTHPQMYMPRGGVVTSASFGPFVVSSNAIDLYEDNIETARFSNYHFKNFVKETGDSVQFRDDFFFLRKFWDPSYNGFAFNGWRRNANNFTFLRYADVLLLKAEIINENDGPTQEAYDLLNLIRTRAGDTPAPEGMNQDQFREYLFDERGRELIGENHRFFDLKRRGLAYWKQKVEARLGRQVDDHFFFWPIPQGEVDINPALVQNDGY